MAALFHRYDLGPQAGTLLSATLPGRAPADSDGGKRQPLPALLPGKMSSLPPGSQLVKVLNTWVSPFDRNAGVPPRLNPEHTQLWL